MKTLHRLWFVTVRDPDTFAEYQRLVGPVARDYGGLDRSIVPDAVVGDGITAPTFVNLVNFTSDDADDIERDPAFIPIEPLRAASSDLLSIDGWTDHVPAARTSAGRDASTYLIEVARYADGPGAYEAYRARADRAMAPYGHRTEALFTPTAWSAGWPFDPDVVSITSFADPDGMSRFEQDPVHSELEGEAYAAAVAESIWVVGRAAQP